MKGVRFEFAQPWNRNDFVDALDSSLNELDLPKSDELPIPEWLAFVRSKDEPFYTSIAVKKGEDDFDTIVGTAAIGPEWLIKTVETLMLHGMDVRVDIVDRRERRRREQ